MQSLLDGRILSLVSTALLISASVGVGCTDDFSSRPFTPVHSATITSPDSEPVFQPGVHQLLLRDDFDGYQTFANAVAGGWRCSNGTTTNDVTTNPQGACRVIAGRSGSAIRLVYDGTANSDGQEAHAWGRPSLNDAQAGKAGKTFYISYSFRITPGNGFTLDAPRHVQTKWLMLWHGEDRAQFSNSYSYCVNGLPSTLWNFYARGSGASPMKCQGGQVRPPFAKDGVGQWHRATHKYVTQSAAGARDGVAQMWVDGTLILSVDRAHCGVDVPNNAGTNPQNWCETVDLDSFRVNDYIRNITFGSVMTAALWPFSIDWDDVVMWREK